ncbi:MAG: anaerobic ribonucleoside-triphosphate reductase activating protein [Candidatus Pacebacteria bacterium]|nr:anaerobic ribonucleoside-triphosphate reductase activating protein [Candidatus Paceibacterota bacterium]
MRYSGIIKNDIASAPGLCTTFFTQGCPHKCLNCHNPETWSFTGGKEFTTDVLDDIIQSLNAQGIQRNFCLMGGEPLCDENIFLSYLIVTTIKQKSPNTKIYIWTGYVYEDLVKKSNVKIDKILSLIDYLIDGPYVESLRDITLEMRGSSNQRVLQLNIDNIKKI